MRRSVDEQQIELYPVRPWDIAPRDAQDLMSWPFCSLGETPPVRPIAFRRGDPTLPEEETHLHGTATICDPEVLIWAVSRIGDARDRGLRTSRLKAATRQGILTFIRSREGRPTNDSPPRTLDSPPARRWSPISQSKRPVIQRSRKTKFESRASRAEREGRVTDPRSRHTGGLFTARPTIDVSADLRGRIEIAAFERSITVADPLPKTFPRSKRSRP